MSDHGFTAGPWQVKSDYLPDCLTIIANVDGEIIDGTTHYSFDHIATCEDEYGAASLDAVGNARLIAAAPDLFQAVLQYRNDLQFPFDDDSRARRLAMVEALIVKAVGSSKQNPFAEIAQAIVAGEWISHNGGQMPVSTGRVMLRFRDGSESTETSPIGWAWAHHPENHFMHGGDIVAYRVARS